MPRFAETLENASPEAVLVKPVEHPGRGRRKLPREDQVAIIGNVPAQLSFFVLQQGQR